MFFIPDNELDYLHEGGLTRERYVEFCQGADLLLHDAQYSDSEYEGKTSWGHTAFTAALQLAVDAGVRRFGLFHHDPEHTDADIDRFVQICEAKVTRTNSPLEVFGAAEGMDLVVGGSEVDGPSDGS